MLALGDTARGVANLMFMLIGIWMTHSLYKSDKVLWKVIAAWSLAFLAAGVSGTWISHYYATATLTHERISMFCGFSGIFVYIYLFPSVPLMQRIFTYFFVDTSMYGLVMLARYFSVFLFGFFPAMAADSWFLLFYFLFAAAYAGVFSKKLKKPILRGLRVFYNQLKPLAFFAFLCYFTMILTVDPWGPMPGVSLEELLKVICICALTAWMYFIAFRTIEAINLASVKALEAKMLEVQTSLSERYYKRMVENIERIRAVRHDLNHHLRVMEAMCKDRQWDNLMKYMETLQKGSPKEKLPIHCEDYVANVLIAHFEAEARRLGIAFSCAACLPDGLVKDQLKLCVVLGNGLQNALDACKKMIGQGCAPEQTYIRIALKVYKNNVILEIRNSFDGQVALEGEKLKTLKQEPDHGIGLSSIQNTAEQYHGYCRAKFTDKEFVLNVLLNLADQPDMDGEEPEKREPMDLEKGRPGRTEPDKAEHDRHRDGA